MKFFKIAMLAGMIVSACSNSEAEAVREITSSVDTIVVSVTDTLGVLCGDSLLEFGRITDVSFTETGNIIVLDGLKCRMGVYSAEGEHIEFIGRPGEGPGEFQYPRSFAILDDGSVVVSDWGSITITYLDPDLQFDTLITGYPNIAPDRIAGTEEEKYIGMSLEYNVENGEPSGTTYLAEFGRGTEPGTVFCSYPMHFSVDEDGDLNVHAVTLEWDTASDGSLCAALRSDSVWAFSIYGVSGEEVFSTEREWTRVPMSEQELAEGALTESLSRTERGNSMNSRRNFDNIPQYRNAISSIDIDDQDRIWVGQGWTDIPTFEVYDLQGRLLFVAVMPEMDRNSGLRYCFENGYLGFDTDPEDYPKVYVLSVDR